MKHLISPAPQDLRQSYLIFAGKCNFLRPYRLQMRYLGLTLFLAPPLSLADPVQLVGAVRQELQLLLKLFCHELMLVLNTLRISQYQYLLELRDGVDYLMH